jgi:hypothetical protein
MRHVPRRTVDSAAVEKIADGFMLHQPERDRVLYLNHTAVIVLELCDGQLDEAEIARALAELFDLSAPPREEVAECLAALQKQGLVA